jgi:hypothetical protein
MLLQLNEMETNKYYKIPIYNRIFKVSFTSRNERRPVNLFFNETNENIYFSKGRDKDKTIHFYLKIFGNYIEVKYYYVDENINENNNECDDDYDDNYGEIEYFY